MLCSSVPNYSCCMTLLIQIQHALYPFQIKGLLVSQWTEAVMDPNAQDHKHSCENGLCFQTNTKLEKLNETRQELTKTRQWIKRGLNKIPRLKYKTKLIKQ